MVIWRKRWRRVDYFARTRRNACFGFSSTSEPLFCQKVHRRLGAFQSSLAEGAEIVWNFELVEKHLRKTTKSYALRYLKKKLFMASLKCVQCIAQQKMPLNWNHYLMDHKDKCCNFNFFKILQFLLSHYCCKTVPMWTRRSSIWCLVSCSVCRNTVERVWVAPWNLN